MTTKLIYPELSYTIVGILMDIHNQLGTRYQEKYYQRAAVVKLNKLGIHYQKELSIPLTIEDKNIGKYFIDFVIENKIALELKAVPRFNRQDYKQISAYLKAANLQLGILVNFRKPSLEYRRILNPDFKPGGN